MGIVGGVLGRFGKFFKLGFWHVVRLVNFSCSAIYERCCLVSLYHVFLGSLVWSR
jgi:hypothetical protein